MTDLTAPSLAPRPGRRLIDLAVEYNFIVIFLLVALAATLLSPNFLTATNVANLFQQAAVTGVVAVGMTFVILTGNIDLSVGSVAALSGMVVAVLLAGGMPIWAAVLLTLAVGGFCGLVMGAITALAQVPSFIITLAGLVSFRGLTYLMTDGVPVSGLPEGIGALASTPIPVLPGMAISSMGVIFVLLCLLAGGLLRLTVVGETIYATGGNPEAARLAGIRVGALTVAAYAISGFCAGLAAVHLVAG